MLRKGDVVVCAYAGGTDKLETQGTYTVVDILDYEYKGSHVKVACNGVIVLGDYSDKCFMLKSDMIEQVLENAKHG